METLNESIQTSIVSALAPFTTKQDVSEDNLNSKFNNLEAQIRNLFDVLQTSTATATVTPSISSEPFKSQIYTSRREQDPRQASSREKPSMNFDQSDQKLPCSLCGKYFEAERIRNHMRREHP